MRTARIGIERVRRSRPACRVVAALLAVVALVTVRATVAAEEPAPAPPAEKPATVEAAPSPAAVSQTFQLPVFDDGPWKGKFAVYEHANFDFWMDAHGAAAVQLKDNGKPVGKPFVFGAFGVYYVKPVDGRNTHVARRMVSAEKLTGPVKQPTKLVLKGKLEDDVAFIRIFEFQGNRILVSAGFEDPKDIPFQSYAGLGIHMLASHTIDNNTQQRQREEILKGCELETRERVGGRAKRCVYPYAKILRFSGPVEAAVAKGPWGPREVKLGTRNLKNLVLYGHVYEGMCPWEGYSFGVQLVNDDLSPGYRIILTVD